MSNEARDLFIVFTFLFAITSVLLHFKFDEIHEMRYESLKSYCSYRK